MMLADITGMVHAGSLTMGISLSYPHLLSVRGAGEAQLQGVN